MLLTAVLAACVLPQFASAVDFGYYSISSYTGSFSTSNDYNGDGISYNAETGVLTGVDYTMFSFTLDKDAMTDANANGHIAYVRTNADTWGINSDSNGTGLTGYWGKSVSESNPSGNWAAGGSGTTAAKLNALETDSNNDVLLSANISNDGTFAYSKDGLPIFSMPALKAGSGTIESFTVNNDYVTSILTGVVYDYAVTNSDGTFHRTYADGTFALNSTTVTNKTATIVTEQLQINGGRASNLANILTNGDIIVGGNGQLYLQTWTSVTGAASGLNIEISNDIYIGNTTQNGAISTASYSGNVEISGDIILIEDSSITKEPDTEGRGTTTVISGSITGDYTLSLRGATDWAGIQQQLDALTISGGMDLAGLKFDGTKAAAVNLSGTVDVDTLTIATNTTITKTGTNSMTFGKADLKGKLEFAGSGDIEVTGEIKGINSGVAELIVDKNITLKSTSLHAAWSMPNITVDGIVETDTFKLSTDKNTTNVNGTGTIKTKTFYLGNEGVYNLTGVRIEVGSGGIQHTSVDEHIINMGNITIAAVDTWTMVSQNDFSLADASTGTTFEVAKDKTATIEAVIRDKVDGTGETAVTTFGKLNKTGDGILVLSGNNTYSGGTTITGGVLKTTHKKALGSGTLTFNGGTLTLASDLDVNSIVNENDATKNLQGYTLSVTNGVTGDNKLVVQNGTLIIGKDLTLNGNLTLEKYTTGEDENAVTHGAEIQLYGKDNTVNVLDLSNGGNAKGKVVLKESSATSIKNGYNTDSGALWMNSSSYIELEKDASLTWEKAKVIGISSETKGQISTTSDNENLYLGSQSATISNVKLTVTEESNTDVNINLQNVELTNDGTGTLALTNSDNTLTALHALEGSVTVTGQDELVLNALTIAKGNTLTVDTVAVGGSSVVYSAENTGATATLEGGATINGSLNLRNASSLTLDGIGEGSLVKITGNLILPEASETPTLTLSGDILSSLNAMNQGDELGIFSVQGGFFVGDKVTDALDATNGIALKTVFSAGEGYNFEDYYLGFTPGTGDEAGYSTVYIGKIVPEPTTATLSLLALAALAARRRRR